MAVTITEDEATRVLNGFQRDARATLEYLLPMLRQRGLYPEATVDGWGDSQGGRGTASTVVLTSPKWLKPTDHTKQLARLRLERRDAGAWTMTVSVVAQPDWTQIWSPSADAEWWAALRERIREEILDYHDKKA